MQDSMRSAPPHKTGQLGKVFSRLNNRETLSAITPVIGLIILTIFFTAINPRFLTLSNILNILRQSSIPLILIVGQTFIIVSGALDLSVEGNMTLCGAVVAMLVANDRTPYKLGSLAILIAVAVGALMGLFNGVVHVKARIPSFMVTLGTWFIGAGLAVMLFQGQNFVIRDEAFLSLFIGTTLGIPNPVIVAVVFLAIGIFIQNYTRFGRHVYAIGGGEDLSRMSGIRVDRQKILLFTVAGFFFGVGGVLSAARLGQGTGLIGPYLFLVVSAIVVGGTSLSGGTGGIIRSIFGVLFVIALGNGMFMIGLHRFTQLAAQGLVFVVAVYFTLDRSKIPILK
jgi:ribose transport system permease protein